MNASTKTRQYRQQARAESTDATRQRIVDTAERLFTARYYDEVSIREIAEAAGVAQQTVLNHFGTKDAVFLAGLENFQRSRADARAGIEPDDIAGAVRAIVADYEEVGDSNLRALSLEDRVPALHAALGRGRKSHREWTERTFPGALKGLRGANRAKRIAQLCVATDVYAWRLFRNDHGLTAEETAEAMRAAVAALYPTTSKKGPR